MAVNSFNAQNPPVTTKGDVFTFSTIPTRLGVGANDTVLTADSSTATGLKWSAPASGGMTLLSTTTMSSASTISISSISGSYTNLCVVGYGIYASSATGECKIRFNSTSTYLIYNVWHQSTTFTNENNGDIKGTIDYPLPSTSDNGAWSFVLNIYDYANTSNGGKSFNLISNLWDGTGYRNGGAWGRWVNSAAISSLHFVNTNTFSGGTVKIYGVK